MKWYTNKSMEIFIAQISQVQYLFLSWVFWKLKHFKKCERILQHDLAVKKLRTNVWWWRCEAMYIIISQCIQVTLQSMINCSCAMIYPVLIFPIRREKMEETYQTWPNVLEEEKDCPTNWSFEATFCMYISLTLLIIQPIWM